MLANAAIRAAAVISLVSAAPATALSPATPLDILCGHDYVVAGTVETARISQPPCAGVEVTGIACGPQIRPEFDMDMSVKVTAILGIKNALKTVPVDLGIAIDKPVALSTTNSSPITSNLNLDTPISEFTGKHYLFAISILHGRVWHNGTIIENYVASPPYPSLMYDTGQQDWILEAISKSDGNSCPAPESTRSR